MLDGLAGGSQTVPMTTDCPTVVSELAAQTVKYVAEATGITLEFNSETLPVLDHYLDSVSGSQPEIANLVCATAGAYFGETIRQQLGGAWDLTSDDPLSWRFRLISGLSFCAAGVVAEAIACGSDTNLASEFDTPAQLRPHLEDILGGMGQVSAETYYSLCGRFDTLEHIHDSLLAIAARLQQQQPTN